MYYKNILIFFLISFIMISPKVISQEINSVDMQELLLDIINPNENISKNIERLKKNINCSRENSRKVFCETANGEITLSRRGRSTNEVMIPSISIDIYSEDGISIFLDTVIEAVREIDYEMKSISGVVFIFNLSDRSFVLSLAGLVIKSSEY
jgi:hypothetical protein